MGGGGGWNARGRAGWQRRTHPFFPACSSECSEKWNIFSTITDKMMKTSQKAATRMDSVSSMVRPAPACTVPTSPRPSSPSSAPAPGRSGIAGRPGPRMTHPRTLLPPGAELSTPFRCDAREDALVSLDLDKSYKWCNSYATEGLARFGSTSVDPKPPPPPLAKTP